MKHLTEQHMLFYFLNQDYDRPWEDIKEILDYGFGDYRFSTLTPDEIMPIARVLWASLHGKNLRPDQASQRK